MDIQKKTGKRGNLSNTEKAIIAEGVDAKLTTLDIQKKLQEHDTKSQVRSIITIDKHIKQLIVDDAVSLTVHNTKDLRLELHAREYYPYIVKQYTADELQYFEAMWVQLMQQFREDIKPSEEMSLKEFINLDILMTRGHIERKQHIEEAARLQKDLEKEYAKSDDDPSKDFAMITMLEQQVATVKNSAMSFTTEYVKLLDQQKSISKDLKANRDARIKRVEDSKTSWAGLMRALDDEQLRERLGDEAALMKLAKEKVRGTLSEWHEFADGVVDQPFLTPESVKKENE